MCTATDTWLLLLLLMPFFVHPTGGLWQQNLLEQGNASVSNPKSITKEKVSRRRTMGIPWRRLLQKVPFSLRLHDVSALWLFVRQTLQNASCLSNPSSSHSSWRTSNKQLFFLASANWRTNWLVPRGCLMTKEEIALQITRAIYKNRQNLESSMAYQCLRSYFIGLEMDDLIGIAIQYGVKT